MSKKFFLSAVMLCAFAAASYATDYVRIDLNYYCRGTLKCLSPKKKGVQIVPRRDYPNGKHPDKCFYSITVNLDLTQEIDLLYEVVDTGDKDGATIHFSVQPIRIKDGKRSENVPIECLEFEACDEMSDVAPCKFDKWTKMVKSQTVSKGDKFTVKAKFKKVED